MNTPTRSRQSIMLCHPYDMGRVSKWDLPWLAQPKLDGVRCLAYVNRDSVILRSSTDRVITTFPHIDRAILGLSLLDNPALKNFPGVTLDGEIYSRGLSCAQVAGMANRNNPDPLSSLAEFHVFDLKVSTRQDTRLAVLESMGINIPCVRTVPHTQVRSEADILDQLKAYIKQGYEGIILRNPNGLYEEKRSNNIVKWKPRRSDSYTIYDVQEEISIHGDPKGSLGALILTDGEGNTFKVGTGFTRNQREELWKTRENLIGMQAEIFYQELTEAGGVPRFPVLIRVL